MLGIYRKTSVILKKSTFFDGFWRHVGPPVFPLHALTRDLYDRSVREKDTSDALLSVQAIVFDALAVFGGFMLATWIKFESDLLPLEKGIPQDVYEMYAKGAGLATVFFLLAFQFLGLYNRPQVGAFTNRIPRCIKGTGAGILLTAVLGFAIKTNPPFSTHVVAISFFTISFLVILERYILYRIEWNLSRHRPGRNDVIIIGTDTVASRLSRTLKREHMLRSRIIGYVQTEHAETEKDVPKDQIMGILSDLETIIESRHPDQIILTSSTPGRARILEIMLLCERNLIQFNMVPDMFFLMTTNMDVQTLDDIPLLGMRRWPLDILWCRLLKRAEDILGALIGMIIAAPIVAIAALLIKKASPGPVFFSQDRCGEKGETFTLHKLRTMHIDAEKDTGPVFASVNDARRTAIGTTLRRHNLDELPQLWNVLRGEMSLVGPRPERPHFVEQFKADVSRYMWRHVSKPGMTGWAQVNGLRGDTSIEQRVKYDLYYLENWSLALDFKILLKTFLASQNAY